MSTSQPPLPNPPFIPIPNLNNFRDAALACNGLTTPEGKIRPGILFRSAEVSHLDVEGWKAVREAGVGHVFDLRSKPEVEKGWRGISGTKKGDQGGGVEKELGIGDVRIGWEEAMIKAGVKRTWCPVFPAEDYSPERLAERSARYMDAADDGFTRAYHDILSHAGPAFRTILQYLASLPPPDSPKQPQDTPVGALIHCSAGKDRTGLFFALLLSFLGVPDAQIAHEYHLTELGLAHVHEQIIAHLMHAPVFRVNALKRMAERNPALGVTPTDLDGALVPGEMGKVVVGGRVLDVPEDVVKMGREDAKRMVGARRESMLRVLEMVGTEWGGAEGYLRGVCGLLDGELEGLKRVLLVRS